MTLDAVLSSAAQHRKELTLYGPPETEFLELLATRNVETHHRRLPPDQPEPFCVIRDDDGFRGAVALADLESFLAPPVHRPQNLDDIDPAKRAVFELLDDTVFTGLSRKQLLATSREFEDRAWRTGTGRLHVGFQSTAAFRAQESLYVRLAAETDLEVHIYTVPEATPSETNPPLTFHRQSDDRYWFVLFDGGDEHCALVAEEQDGEFSGVWTYDPDLVALAFEEI